VSHGFPRPFADAALPLGRQPGVIGVNANDTAGFGLGGFHGERIGLFVEKVNLEGREKIFDKVKGLYRMNTRNSEHEEV
jgi:hypothetical protein